MSNSEIVTEIVQPVRYNYHPITGEKLFISLSSQDTYLNITASYIKIFILSTGVLITRYIHISFNLSISIIVVIPSQLNHNPMV